jgi:hypothetical protein
VKFKQRGFLLDPYRFSTGGSGSTETLDPLKKAPNLILSNGNLTASGASCGLSVTGKSAGKFYFEMRYDSNSSGFSRLHAVGVSRNLVSLTTDLGQEAGEYGYRTDGYKYLSGSYINVGVSYNVGDVVGCAVDISNLKIWWSKNGLWLQSGDPALDLNPMGTLTTGLYYAAIQMGSDSFCTMRFNHATCSYSPPSGFNEW